MVRLDDGGVALFHIAQAWAYRGTWVPYTSVMIKPASVEYLALGTSVLLAVRWKIEISDSEKVDTHFQAPGSQ